ncbi:MAG: Membrane protein of unknown function [Blastococcus sp.]|jgi:hypothetical protein|nr:Membrane protein of unknown function [Blastococcus sp.]
MDVVARGSFALARVRASLLGPRLPAFSALWQTGGRRGVTAGICVVLPLVAGAVWAQPALGTAASLGALTAIYGHALPYRRRGLVVAGVGLALTLAAGLGALVGGHPVVLSLAAGAVAAAAGVASGVWRTGPPGPLGAMLVYGGSSALAGSVGLGSALVAAAGGAALAWCGCMLPWLWDPTGPERRAVGAAERAVAAVEKGGPWPTRPGAVAHAVRTADAAVGWAGRSRDDVLETRLRDIEQRFLRALPAGLAAASPAPMSPEPENALRRRWWERPLIASSLRIGLGATAAALTATAVGLQNPYWAATTAVAVQLGTDARHTRDRAVNRAAGTVLGVLIAWLIIGADLPVGVEIGLVGLLQFAVEMLVAHQYGLAVAVITPMVLVQVHIGVPSQPGVALVEERLAETAIGITLGVVVGLTLFLRAGSRRLPGAVAGAATAAVAAARTGAGADRRLHDALVDLGEVMTAARTELFPPASTSAGLDQARSVADLGWGLLGARARGDDALAAALALRITDDLTPRAT